MESPERIRRKKTRMVVGLMSGTSADGVDAVVVKFHGQGLRTQAKTLAYATYFYGPALRNSLLRNSDSRTARLDDIARLNIYLGEVLADCVRKIVRKAGLRISQIDLVGSHGHTVQHLPEPTRYLGRVIRSTMQIGSPSVIAKLTGVVTVGDFRVGDVGVGGSGAPLVPYFDYLMFRSATVTRALLNIGGIANITILPKNCSLDDVIAFDTGPGNMVVDALAKRFYGLEYDKGGRKAAAGRVLPAVLRWMMAHPYLTRKPPKSTGRELFGRLYIDKLLKVSRGCRKADVLTTASEFVALSVFSGYRMFRPPKSRVTELIVSGGGVHNTFIMESLRRYFAPISVKPVEQLGISSDAKEAICFALLANETVSGGPTNVRGATGARTTTSLGQISLP